MPHVKRTKSGNRMLGCLVLLVGLILAIMVVERLPVYFYAWRVANIRSQLPTEAEIEAFDEDLAREAEKADREILESDP